jgi:putative spermidine/putrescine transport system ATP-binding protein
MVENSDAGVVLTHVSKEYQGKRVVDDVCLTVEKGEFVTFLGPSGSGKTTTLNMIAGFASVSEGDIQVHGRMMGSVPPHKRDIGMVFQAYALFPHRTVRGNIAFPLERRRMPKAQRDELIDQALSMVHMTPFGDRYPDELSGGQQQRVALARALVYKPAVLLMDEPLGALDKKLRDWLQTEIKRIHREVKSTFLYVTHDQEEALSLSDRVAVFNNGRIEQIGTPADLYERPNTLFVGTFVGESTLIELADVVSEGATSSGSAFGVAMTGRGAVSAPSASLLVRPERIHLSPVGDEAEPEPHSVLCEVELATYLGNAWRYELVLPDGSKGYARNDRSPEAIGFTRRVRASWSPDDAVVLAQEGATSHFLT